ncbi:MAG: hypothetical protein A2381_05325 [Bdellovibrionales bacterium RIFOXYB1_FULL_37_110]|nr:MAG: hypothetical protein A2417_16805 [Bdellovibrionales bacterium RIFOXYC1_FULL_37_79]OFZ58167.1 MAG: hypothetical protein A2381_05325 [Bdellovibrionales bacterium RIFOXYB1_FULL_37_110]OFZ61856.1 MAG: hypothetical protein A2577_18910 [Bdellovibrionales bacterium RIFOXYD1_FULL_36_51]
MIPFVLERLKYAWIKKYKEPGPIVLEYSGLGKCRFILLQTLKWLAIFFDLFYKTTKTFILINLELFRTNSVKELVQKLKLFLPTFILKSVNDIQGKLFWNNYRFACLTSRGSQIMLLKKILDRNADTEFGKKYGFKDIRTLEDFQTRLPVFEYEDLRPYMERHCRGEANVLIKEKPFLYATTSGTTGKPKYLPITKTTAKNGHTAVSRIWLYNYSMKAKNMFDGKILAIVSPAVEGYVEDGTPFGSTSGHMYKSIPQIIRRKYVIPSFVMGVEDYTAKYYAVLLLGLREKNITYLASANPSTIYLLCQKMNEWKESLIADIENGTVNESIKYTKDEKAELLKFHEADPDRALELKELFNTHKILRPSEIWPNLKTIGCWTGGNAGNFIKSMKSYFTDDTQIRDIGYLASELRGSIPIYPGDTSGILTIQENFFEFAEVDAWNNGIKDQFKMVHQLEVGKSYYLFMTNNSGLYRYNMNDIIKVTGYFLTTPMIVFLQKGKGVCNITGEKLYESQIMEAIEKTKEEMNLPLVFYFLYANVEQKCYEMIAEFSTEIGTANEEKMLLSIETKLKKINIEYKAKRDSLRLGAIVLRKIRSGSFNNYKAKKVKEGQREGQFKMVILSGDTKVRDELLSV